MKKNQEIKKIMLIVVGLSCSLILISSARINEFSEARLPYPQKTIFTLRIKQMLPLYYSCCEYIKKKCFCEDIEYFDGHQPFFDLRDLNDEITA